MTPDKLDKIRMQFIEDALTDFDKAVETLQKELYKYVIEEYSSRMSFTDGKTDFNAKNFAESNRISADLQKFIDEMQPTFRELAKQMVETVAMSQPYYNTIGTVTSDKINAHINILRQRVGINVNGSIIKDSWIDRISKLEPVKQKIADYVSESIAKNATYKEFRTGMNEVVNGSKDIDGVMKRYTRQYVHDTFFKVARTVDNFFADELQLDYFIYMGDLIDTSRPFCQDRAGKVFHRSDVAEFPKNLPYFQPDYDFFNDLGGYNCRHWLRWISKELAKQKGYDVTLHK